MDHLTASIASLRAAIADFSVRRDAAYAVGNNCLGNAYVSAVINLDYLLVALVNSTEHLPRLFAKATDFGIKNGLV